MPRVINPTDTPLFCEAAHELIPGLGAIEVSQEVADNVPRMVFQIEADEPTQAESEASPVVLATDPELSEAEKLLAAAETLTKQGQ